MKAVAILVLSLLSTAWGEYSLSFFDELRKNSTNQSDSTVTYSQGEVSDIWSVKLSDGDSFNLAHLSVFLPFSDGTSVRAAGTDEMAAAILSIHHFNNPKLSPHLTSDEDMAALEECNLKFTAEYYDTRYSPIDTTRLFTSILQRDKVFSNPPPSGVIGAYRSAVTSPLAILSGVNAIPQVSYASTSTDFDVKEQYPYFGRTIQSSIGEAEVLIRLFQNLGSSHIGILFVTDAYGSALQKAFQDAATETSIVTDSVGFSYSADLDGDEIRNAVESLKGNQFRHFFVIAFELHYEAIMTAAYEKGLIGDDFLWIYVGMDYVTFQRIAKFASGSALAKATSGVGIVNVDGGVRPEIRFPEVANMPPLAENPSTSYELFRTAWRESIESTDFDKYARSRVPSTVENVSDFNPDFNFSLESGAYVPFMYDAVTGLALAYCRALNEVNDTNAVEFDGEEVFKKFSQLDFNGASGQVQIIEESGTRNHATVTFLFFNVQPHQIDENNTQNFKLVPIKSFSTNGWVSVESREFVYANGGTTTPSSLPPPNVEYNYIGEVARAVGYSLMGLVFLGSFVAFAWLLWYRNARVVVSSQPLFLFMVSFGSLVMASSIFPLGLEEPLPTSSLDSACMAAPWLYVSGSVVAFSSLLAKTRAVRHALINPNVDFIHVTNVDILATFSVLFTANFIVMICWQLVSPLEWARVPGDSTDIFDRVVESYATCSSDDAIAFVVVIVIMNIGILVVANWWAYQARNIETEYHESLYIGISMASILQAWCMGIPIIIVVWDNPQAKFFVEAGIIFVTALAVQLLIFIPKMIANRTDMIKGVEDQLVGAEIPTPPGDCKKESFEDERRKSIEALENNDGNQSDLSIEGAIEDTAAVSAAADVCVSTEESSKTENDVSPAIPEEVSNSPRRSLSRVTFVESISRSLRFSSGAMSQNSASVGDGSLSDISTGLRVTHNPRSSRNLQVSGGVEFSRMQIENLEDGISEPFEILPAMNESLEEDSANPFGKSIPSQ